MTTYSPTLNCKPTSMDEGWSISLAFHALGIGVFNQVGVTNDTSLSIPDVAKFDRPYLVNHGPLGL